ncbi:MAG: two-component system chemotaxis family sensor kinase [Gallionellaceae bacterium]|nr:MAG: two-component system chemotaxis family sensor kinase [Gallionellaceae bacterium]
MSFDLSQFYQVFFEEAAEHLTNMESLLLSLEVNDPSMDDLNAIFRAAHSIKGGAGTFGFTDMTEVTHVLETLLDKLRKQEMALTNEMVNAFLEAGDAISMQLAGHRDGTAVDEQIIKDARAKLERLSSADQSAAPAAPSSPVIAPVKAPDTDPGYGFFDDEPAPAAQNTAGAEDSQGYGFFEETPVQKTERETVRGYGFLQEPNPDTKPEAVAPVAEQTPAAVQAVPHLMAEQAHPTRRAADRVPPPAAADSSIRVSVEKVDQLINLVGELVITQAMLTQSASLLDPLVVERLQSGLSQLQRNTRDIQEAVMAVRMLPISFVFSRFPRVVRDMASKLGKQIELKTLGEGTELDKGLIEKIADPLTHLIRNSLDHGIEMPEKRVAAGKSPTGTITLNAFHQGGNIVIEVADDGGGLSRTRILNKARERGMNVSDDMPDSAVWMLIYEAGFSTAEVVTDVSGRGVGMDVVKRNIAELGGRVEIDSAEGYGTRTTIRLPLTLAILDGLSVSVGGQVFIAPLGSIVESLQVNAEDLKSVSGEGHLLRVRGEYLPLVSVHEVFNIQNAITDFTKGIVVIIEAEGKKTALMVDELLGQHQVVIKSLASNFRKVQGISGATIMGDGKVALILDVQALAAQHKSRNP